jgi:hypothetical protein
MDLYSYCDGDPVNQYDADGRIGKGVGGAVKDTVFGLGALAYNGVGSAAYGITSGFGYYNNSVSDIYSDQWQGMKNVGTGLGNLATQLKNQDFKGVGMALTGGDNVSVGYRIGYTAANIGGLFLGGEGIAAKFGSFSKVGEISDGLGVAAKSGTVVEQYALRAADSGFYPVMTRGSSKPTGITWLEKGDVWKLGTTKNPATRYSDSFLRNTGDYGLRYSTEWQGTASEALQLERMKIMNFQSQTGGVLPAGNKIVR